MSNLKEYVVIETYKNVFAVWPASQYQSYAQQCDEISLKQEDRWRIITTFSATDELKDSPYQGSAGVWRSDRVPDLADGKKAIPHYVKVKKQTHGGKGYVSKRVAYYFPDRFKSVEFEDWDDYDQEDFPYTTEDEEKGVVWLNAGWYESVNCDRCDEYWSAPLEVLEWLDSAATPAGDGWVSVEEKEPELSKQYLVYDPHAVIKIYTAFCLPIATTERAGCFMNGSQPCFSVTHFRELPSPPNKSV